MKSLNTNVRDADSNTTKHRFPWKWRLSDLKDVEKNGKKVFSCFSCGGGSTMGYKLAGYTVVGNCEIDEEQFISRIIIRSIPILWISEISTVWELIRMN